MCVGVDGGDVLVPAARRGIGGGAILLEERRRNQGVAEFGHLADVFVSPRGYANRRNLRVIGGAAEPGRDPTPRAFRCRLEYAGGDPQPRGRPLLVMFGGRSAGAAGGAGDRRGALRQVRVAISRRRTIRTHLDRAGDRQ